MEACGETTPVLNEGRYSPDKLSDLCRDLGLAEEQVLNVYLIGSRVYGTASKSSDYDFMIVMDAKYYTRDPLIQRENVDASCYNILSFLQGLKWHILCFIMCIYLPKRAKWREEVSFASWETKMDLGQLRAGVSAEAARTWRKARHKLEHEDLPALGRKDIVHSFREFLLGTQLARKHKIEDWQCANEYYAQLQEETAEEWNHYKAKYHKEYKSLYSAFKQVAPKKSGYAPFRGHLTNPQSEKDAEELVESLDGSGWLEIPQKSKNKWALIK